MEDPLDRMRRQAEEEQRRAEEKWRDGFEPLMNHECKITPELEFAVQTLANQNYRGHDDWIICEERRFNERGAWGKVMIRTKTLIGFQAGLEFTADEAVAIAGMLRSKTVMDLENSP
ncbi:MAG: hypothetical protein KME42_00975 [Tildeniella nuda ZEHNDER 1965/U140]|nr:hypothetical protein [Tildeniella nuda ZEHNDER 1965/U140]